MLSPLRRMLQTEAGSTAGAALQARVTADDEYGGGAA